MIWNNRNDFFAGYPARSDASARETRSERGLPSNLLSRLPRELFDKLGAGGGCGFMERCFGFILGLLIDRPRVVLKGEVAAADSGVDIAHELEHPDIGLVLLEGGFQRSHGINRITAPVERFALDRQHGGVLSRARKNLFGI